jgi:hypothetical protein
LRASAARSDGGHRTNEEIEMMRKLLVAGAIALAAANPALAAKGEAGESLWDWLMLQKMSDANKDGMVSKKEFLDAMSKAYDAAMKGMAGKPGMVKDDNLTMEAYKEFIRTLYHGA